MDPAAVQSFCDTTGATPEQAAHLLAAYGGDVESAVNAFFGARAATHGARRDSAVVCALLSAAPCAPAEDGGEMEDDAQFEDALGQPVRRCRGVGAARPCKVP